MTPQERAEETQAMLARKRAERAEQVEATLRQRFLDQGGTEEQWAAEGSAILTAARAEATLAGDSLVRRTNQRRYA